MFISKEQHWRYPANKLEEEKKQSTRLIRKTPTYGKTKRYFNKPSKWLKRMIVRDQAGDRENVFVFEFGLIVPAVLKRLF